MGICVVGNQITSSYFYKDQSSLYIQNNHTLSSRNIFFFKAQKQVGSEAELKAKLCYLCGALRPFKSVLRLTTLIRFIIVSVQHYNNPFLFLFLDLMRQHAVA